MAELAPKATAGSSACGQQLERQIVELAVECEWRLVICVVHTGSRIGTHIECFASLKCEWYGVGKRTTR